jgi:hypothetical protein
MLTGPFGRAGRTPPTGRKRARRTFGSRYSALHLRGAHDPYTEYMAMTILNKLVSRAGTSLILALLGGNNEEADAPRVYGAPQTIGNGTVRSYVTVDPRDPRVPLEVGVAISASAMEGLPGPRANAGAHGAHSGHEMLDSHTLLLDLPKKNPTPFTFVQFDWNPGGHEPPGVYDEPHFDFHFWTASRKVRESIVPENPEYAKQAAALPGEEFRMPLYVDGASAAKVPASAAAVPRMGLHWLDVRSPELQGLAGFPEKQQKFTKTFIYGSWDGRFVFAEPMITRAYILSKRSATDPAQHDEIIPVSTPKRAQVPGYYPAAYRITYDAAAHEFRIALTTFEYKN